MREIIIDAGEYVVRDTDAQRWADLMEIRINASGDRQEE